MRPDVMTPCWEYDGQHVYQGDCFSVLRSFPSGIFAACVTSPPYWGGIRNYGHVSQLGTEASPEGYVQAMLDVFEEVRRVLVRGGCLWLNVGDVYAASGKGGGGNQSGRFCWGTIKERKGFRMPPPGYKQKDLTLTPFQLADALRRSGWYLRSTVIWCKPSSSEPMRIDRPAVSHEYVFLFSTTKKCLARDPGEPWWCGSVWVINQEREVAHPAAMPTELARRCIVSGSRSGEVVLDPFMGSGTTLQVARALSRHGIGIELNPAYIDLARERIGTSPKWAERPKMSQRDEAQCGLFREESA